MKVLLIYCHRLKAVYYLLLAEPPSFTSGLSPELGCVEHITSTATVQCILITAIASNTLLCVDYYIQNLYLTSFCYPCLGWLLTENNP